MKIRKLTIKRLLIGSFFIIPSIFGCQKHDDMDITTPTQIESSIQGLITSNENAKLYNDSIIWGLDIKNSSSHEFLFYCDSMFHSYDNEYEMYHDMHSHMNNNNNNHHHNNNAQCCSMNNSGNNNHEFGCDVNMKELRIYHRDYHNSVEKLR